MMVRAISISAMRCRSLRKASDPVASARVPCLFGWPCGSALGLLEEADADADADADAGAGAGAHTEAETEVAGEDTSMGEMKSSCACARAALLPLEPPLMLEMMPSATL